MPLHSELVPSGVTHLIPLADKWNIGDDFERSQAVRRATVGELSVSRRVSRCIGRRGPLWMAGGRGVPARSDPSPEYIAFSNLALALDEARLRLQQECG